MRTARLLVFVFAASLWPAIAQASIWSWLEELSGPGPFHGDMASLSVACRNGQWDVCWAPNDQTSQTIVLRIGRYDSGDRSRFKDLKDTPDDDRKPVHAVPVSVLWMFRIHRSLHVGAGAGFMRVSGAGFTSFSKVSLTPLSATFTPLALLRSARARNHRMASVIRLEFDSSFFGDGFDAADFQNTHSKFDSGPEFLTRTGVVVDVFALVGSATSGFKR